MTVLSVPAAAQFSAVAVAVYSVVPSVFSWSMMGIDDQDDLDGSNHTGDFPRGVGHRVEKGWGLTKCAVVLLNDIIMVKINIYS